jgi:hypothetical protein
MRPAQAGDDGDPRPLAPYAEPGFGKRGRLWMPSLEPLLDEPEFREILRISNLEGVRPQRAPPETGADAAGASP